MASSQGILLSHLPGIFHSSEDLIELLNVFEETLFGVKPFEGEGASDKRFTGLSGLVPLIDATPNLSNPYFKGEGFLSVEESKRFLIWLSEWVAISQPHLFDDEQLRKLVANAVPLYSMRGTKEYLITMLSYLGIKKSDIEIDDQGLPVFTVGQSALGMNTRLGDLPFLFRVRVRENITTSSAEESRHFKYRVQSVIELAKPAHTLFELKFSDKGNSEGGVTESSDVRLNPSNLRVSP